LKQYAFNRRSRCHSLVTEALAVAAASGALEVAAAAADLSTDLGAIGPLAAVAVAPAAVTTADLAMRAAQGGVVETDTFAAAVASAPGIARPATFGFVAGARATEAATADGIEPTAAMSIAFQSVAFRKRRLGWERENGRSGVAPPGSFSFISDDRARGYTTETEERFQQRAARAAPGKGPSCCVE
jgi:hypothetical protein